MTPSLRLESAGPEQTLELGRRIAAALGQGSVVGLIGPLGAGKTLLTKGLVEGLGAADRDSVNSPTFVLVNEYCGESPGAETPPDGAYRNERGGRGSVHVFHVDVYRLGGIAELDALGFEEMCGAGGVVIVEWADRVAPALPASTLWIEIESTGSHDRRLTLRCTDASAMTSIQGALQG